MQRILFFMLLTFGTFTLVETRGASAESEACGKEIQHIDQQVQKLEQQKGVHQDLARQYQKLGDNWQYSTGNIQDAYANWGRADQERRKAIDLQHQIDLLLQRKGRIIQFYPELYQP
ncbi:MAG TPA: hypothetical protein VFU89_05340 [Rhabdochlamydiaceae bacterium]|nr:hypothetical protein [Rhabdochlamydiaceae bacterium]